MTIDGKVPRLAYGLNHGNIGVALRVEIVRADGGQTMLIIVALSAYIL
jgi:hypothetical protein